MKRLSDVLGGAREAPAPMAPTSEPGSDSPPERVRGIPTGRVDNRFDNFRLDWNPSMAVAKLRCEEVASGFRPRAFLAGRYGNGKTHLAIAALNAWRKEYGTGYFWKVPDFLSWIRRSVMQEGHDLDKLLEGYCFGAALIVFDDLGAENRTEFAGEQLYRVLDARYDNDLPTIITSNVDLSQLDGRLTSRYRDGLVICAGQDVRGRV